jgi:hypothetical protein
VHLVGTAVRQGTNASPVGRRGGKGRESSAFKKLDFYRELTQAQLQQVTDREPYRDRQGMVPDLALHGLGGTSAQYYELKRLRASKSTYPWGPNTGVAKRTVSVQVEHVRKSRKQVAGSWIKSSTEPTLTLPLPQVLSCGALGH